jgi:SAM-dependent methyltransferase
VGVRPGGETPELERLAQLGWRADELPITDSGVHVVDQNSAVDYPTAGLTALGLDGGSGYWFDHRAAAVVEALTTATDARAIWDVGAGTGAMSLRLASSGFEVVSVEPLIEGATAIKQLGGEAVFCGSLDALRLPNDCLRLVGLFDVIEHLGEPSDLLNEVHRVLEPGGMVVVTVPALQALWSTEDEVAGHHRRYTRKSLDTSMESCGFRTLRSEYLFASLVFPALALRAIPYRLGRRRAAETVHRATAKQLAPSARVDTAARRILRVEGAMSRRVRLPAGLSVVGLYEAREGGESHRQQS